MSGVAAEEPQETEVRVAPPVSVRGLIGIGAGERARFLGLVA